MAHQISSSSIKTKALALLARREYTRAELEQKLLAWARTFACTNQDDETKTSAPHNHESNHRSNALSIEQEVETILNALQTRGLLSDERALESLLHQKTKRFGVNRIRQDLITKGFDTTTIQTALEELKETEFDRALTTWQRKFSNPPQDPASYNKQARFLAYRGFSAETVRKVLEQIRKDNH